MKQIDKILHHISILFYIFVGLFVVGTIYGFFAGLLSNATTKPSVDHHSITEAAIMCTVALMMIVAGVWSMILFVKLLVNIGRSIARKNIFDLKTVRIINRYSIMYSITILLLLIFQIGFRDFISNDIEEIYFFSEMISSTTSMVMLLMFGQVLRIGYILKQEQELTI